VELPKTNPPQTNWVDVVPLVTRSGTLHGFILKWDQTDTKAPFPKLALWHLKAEPPYETWTEPQLLYDGYIGALLSAVELENGTIVVPFAYMTDRHYSKPAPGLMGYVYMGEHTTTVVYSQDGGQSFLESPTPLNVRASIIIGNENGAIEPVCLPLRDGRVWMLFRAQTGRQWESFSKDGVQWSPPRPSRFISSDSPASLTRLSDGRVIVIWNCCQRYPYAHGGRQVLHAAISSDEGKTWHGFREVLRDPQRLEPAHPIRGDYGTAYAIGAPTSDGKLLFATGQGQTTGVFLLDPAWLTEQVQFDDFANGLETWSVYGTKGVEIVPHPMRTGAQACRIQRIDKEFPAGAVWNFPNGRKGTLIIRFQLLAGQGGTSIVLTDHFSSPFDREAELNGLFHFTLSSDGGSANDRPLEPERSYELGLTWDLDARRCVASIDGMARRELPQLRLASDGVNYVRFRAASDEPSDGGLLIESISSQIELATSSYWKAYDR
jgi:hypothetical protein